MNVIYSAIRFVLFSLYLYKKFPGIAAMKKTMSYPVLLWIKN